MLKQQAVLHDSFGRKHDYIRISVTDKCNLRCVYCMPEEGLPFFPDESVLSCAEIIQMVKNFARMGIKKVRLTGGEPLMRSDIIEIIEGISAIAEIDDISMTTNGLALPKLAKKLYHAGLDRLNISLDTFNKKRYKEITRGGNLDRLLKGIDTANKFPFKKIKINTVVINGQNDHEIADFLRYTFDHDVNLRFIEFMPIQQDEQWAKQYRGLDTIFDTCQTNHWGYDPISLDGNGPSENYKIRGAKGSFGLIHPISCNFCESCNRLRITADGYIKSCLYWDDEENIRDTIFDFASFQEKIQQALAIKPKNHEMALLNQEQVKNKKPTWRHMSQIGG